MKKVFEAPPSDPEAGLIKDILEKEGIECELRNEGASAAMGIVPPPECYAEVWVIEPGDVDRAEEIVRNWRQARESTSSWTCPKCGEQIQDQFTSCWKCGAERSVPVL